MVHSTFAIEVSGLLPPTNTKVSDTPCNSERNEIVVLNMFQGSVMSKLIMIKDFSCEKL